MKTLLKKSKKNKLVEKLAYNEDYSKRKQYHANTNRKKRDLEKAQKRQPKRQPKSPRSPELEKKKSKENNLSAERKRQLGHGVSLATGSALAGVGISSGKDTKADRIKNKAGKGYFGGVGLGAVGGAIKNKVQGKKDKEMLTSVLGGANIGGAAGAVAGGGYQALKERR